MAPNRCAAHNRAYPCGACTAALWQLLDARAAGAPRLWACDLDAITAVLTRGLPDLTVCRCGRGSTFYHEAERCSCKGGKTTPLRLAEQRCDDGAAWQREDVTVGGQRLSGDDPAWQRHNAHGASKEALMALNLIKAKSKD
jgi:hypothetical protein